MRKNRLSFIVSHGIVAMTFVTVAGFGLCACSGLTTQEGSTSYISEGSNVQGTAATVNDNKISEQAVADRVAAFRQANELTDDDAWASWLKDAGLTSESYRSQVINTLIDEELVREAAAERGVAVSDADVDKEIEQHRGAFSNDEEWQAFIRSLGFTDDTYRDSVYSSLLHDRLVESFAEENDVSDDDLIELANASLPVYAGAKRSSQIVFAADQTGLAQQVLDELLAGSIDFQAAARRYSADETSRLKNGDMGWNVLVALPTAEYAQTLSGLSLGQISPLVTSSDGVRIIMCTDVFNPPERISSLDEIPIEFQDAVRKAFGLTSSEDMFNNWFTSFRGGADIQINDMPANLPYDVDIS